MLMNGRIDGHIVQGHVDGIATCTNILEENGSWKYDFSHHSKEITVEKGSITINGTSLTVVNSASESFSVCIIPYTYHNTNFHEMKVGDSVNIEFDIIGKYVSKWLLSSKI
jgi:riboflavin synthase